MFDNIGNKIKVVAAVFCWIGIIASVIFGIIMINDGDAVLGVVTLVVGVLSSWIGSFALYGFGQLVENSDLQAERMLKMQTYIKRLSDEFSSFIKDANDHTQKKDVKQGAIPSPANAPTPLYSPVHEPTSQSLSAANPEKTDRSQEHSDSHKNTLTTFILLDADHIRCKKCGTTQRSGRAKCWGCGATFIQEDSPES